MTSMVVLVPTKYHESCHNFTFIIWVLYVLLAVLFGLLLNADTLKKSSNSPRKSLRILAWKAWAEFAPFWMVNYKSKNCLAHEFVWLGYRHTLPMIWNCNLGFDVVSFGCSGGGGGWRRRRRRRAFAVTVIISVHSQCQSYFENRLLCWSWKLKQLCLWRYV